MTTTLYLVPEPEERTALGLLETLLVDDVALWERFEAACRGGVVELRETVLGFRSALLESGHFYDSHDEQFEETFHALLALAEDYLPDSAGAFRARLQERVRGSVTPRPDGGVKMKDGVGVQRAVEITVAHEDRFFDDVVLASRSHARLYVIATRVRAALQGIRRKYPVGDVEDELLILVREIAPESPSARPDSERMYEMWRRAQEYVDARPGLDDEERQTYEIRALYALKEHDLIGYRAALRELCRAAREETK